MVARRGENAALAQRYCVIVAGMGYKRSSPRMLSTECPPTRTLTTRLSFLLARTIILARALRGISHFRSTSYSSRPKDRGQVCGVNLCAIAILRTTSEGFISSQPSQLVKRAGSGSVAVISVSGLS